MIKIIDNNFNLHAQQIIDQVDGMQVYESDHLTFTDSNLSCDTFNIIHITNGQKLSRYELETAVHHFSKQQLDFCIWINQQNLIAAKPILDSLKLKEQNKEVGMVLDLNTYTPIAKAEHSNIKVVDTSKKLKDFATVIAENWVPTDNNVLQYYARTAAAYLDKLNEIILLVY